MEHESKYYKSCVCVCVCGGGVYYKFENLLGIKIEDQLTSETHLVSMPKRKKLNYGLHEPNSKIFL